MKKKLIVLRHAHRNVVDPSEDNGLSKKGRQQALAVRDYFLKEFKREKISIFSSPRLRCQETLAPLAEAFDIKVKIDTLLDESAQIKGGPLEKRVPEFIAWWKEKAPEFSVVCSHGDWIPLFFEIALGESWNLKKSGLAELKLSDGHLSLGRVIQSWDLES